MLPQDTMHLIHRPCYQRGCPCQDPAGNQTTWRTDHRKETQTAAVWTCLPFIRSGENHLARHSEREKRWGRQKKRWEDNIREWTGLEFTKSQSAVENREKWRKLFVKSSLVPQQLLQLRDRWRGEAYIICVFSMLPAMKPLSKTGHGISTVHNNLRYEETSSRFPQEKC